MAQVFVNSMSSGNSLVTFDLGFFAYDALWLQVPTMASATNLDIYVATASNATYYQLRQAPIVTGSTQNISFSIAASCTAGGALVPIVNNGSFQFFRVKATDSAPTAAVDFKVICGKPF